MRARFEDVADVLLMRNAGIRAKVTLALAGVLALVIPQIALTVAYMVELFGHGTSVDQLSTLSSKVGGAARLASGEFIKGIPQQRHELADQIDALDRARSVMAVARDGHVEQRRQLDDVTQQLGLYVDELRRAFDSLEALPEPGFPWVHALEQLRAEFAMTPELWRGLFPQPDERQLMHRIAALEEFAFGMADQVVARALNDDIAVRTQPALARQMATQRLAELGNSVLRTMAALEADLFSRGRVAGDEIRATVDRADRYLITLVMLTIVYIFAVILVLPARLVQPLKHVTSVMNRAGLGQLDAQARVVGKDEMGKLAAALNRMLRNVEAFDILKRDRIYEDRGRIRKLADLVSHPLVILDTRHRIEHANGAFLKLFVLPDPYEDLNLQDFVGGPDADAFREALEGVLHRRRPVRGLPVSLTDRRGTHEYLMSTELGRNRQGLVSYLIVRLEPS